MPHLANVGIEADFPSESSLRGWCLVVIAPIEVAGVSMIVVMGSSCSMIYTLTAESQVT